MLDVRDWKDDSLSVHVSPPSSSGSYHGSACILRESFIEELLTLRVWAVSFDDGLQEVSVAVRQDGKADGKRSLRDQRAGSAMIPVMLDGTRFDQATRRAICTFGLWSLPIFTGRASLPRCQNLNAG